MNNLIIPLPRLTFSCVFGLLGTPVTVCHLDDVVVFAADQWRYKNRYATKR